jgi:hypothetical protein
MGSVAFSVVLPPGYWKRSLRTLGTGRLLAQGKDRSRNPQKAAKIVCMNKSTVGIMCAIAAGVAATWLWFQHRALAELREENGALRQQIEQLGALAAENEQLSNALAKASRGATPEQMNELLKLRGEVGNLKRELAETARKQASQAAAARQAPTAAPQGIDPGEQQKEIAIGKMSYGKQWMLAFYQYANQHQGQAPANFEAAAPFLAAEARSQTNFFPEQFEIVYQGSMSEMANPENIIVIREKEAWQAPDGGWARTYSFADGHSEIHKTTDGNFGPWESTHTAAPQVPGQPRQ